MRNAAAPDCPFVVHLIMHKATESALDPAAAWRRAPFCPGAMRNARLSASLSMRCQWIPRAGKPLKPPVRWKSVMKWSTTGLRRSGKKAGMSFFCM